MNKEMLMYASGTSVGKSGLEVAVMDQERERGITVGIGRCHGKSMIFQLHDLLDNQGFNPVVKDNQIFVLDEAVEEGDLSWLLKVKIKDALNFIPADDYTPENLYYEPSPYFEGSLIVPASNNTKGTHAYPWYHGGKW